MILGKQPKAPSWYIFVRSIFRFLAITESENIDQRLVSSGTAYLAKTQTNSPSLFFCLSEKFGHPHIFVTLQSVIQFIVLSYVLTVTWCATVTTWSRALCFSQVVLQYWHARNF